MPEAKPPRAALPLERPRFTLVQPGDPNKIVRWGDHSMTMGTPAAMAGPSPPAQKKVQPTILQGLFKQFGL